MFSWNDKKHINTFWVKKSALSGATENIPSSHNKTVLYFTYFSSLEANGYSLFFFVSVRAINAINSPLSFTIGSLPVNKINIHLLLY